MILENYQKNHSKPSKLCCRVCGKRLLAYTFFIQKATHLFKNMPLMKGKLETARGGACKATWSNVLAKKTKDRQKLKKIMN